MQGLLPVLRQNNTLHVNPSVLLPMLGELVFQLLVCFLPIGWWNSQALWGRILLCMGESSDRDEP